MSEEQNKPKPRILLVEDEMHLAHPLQYNLEQEGYEVVSTPSGRQALALLQRQAFDLIVLDLMIEEIDGLEVARQVRRTDEKLPILMLTARSTQHDRVVGLSVGADDYMVKPFHLPELLLRIRRMLQRTVWYVDQGSAPPRQVTVAGYTVNLEKLEAIGPRGDLQLTALEANLLEALTSAPNRVLSRSELLAKVWGYSSDIETRTVDNFIVRLRRYFEEEPDQPRHFVSVRGRGYMYVP